MARALLLFFALALAPAAAAQTASPEDVKAAFLFRFVGFVEWPAESRTDEGIVFGVVDAEDVEEELRRYAALRTIGGQRPQVRRVRAPADLEGVHVLFIGSADPGRIAAWLAATRRLPILTVTDAYDGLERGSVLNFVTTDRVRFEASTAAAVRAQLRLSSRLLSVAMRVKKGGIAWTTLFASRVVGYARRA
jgi:hypothetical protein